MVGNTHAPSLESIGVKAEPGLTRELRHEVARLLGRDNVNFPGAQPVSFASKHVLELQSRDYYVCEKTDGTRYLLYLARGDENQPEIHYLIDRKNDYTYVPNLHFPMPDDETFQSFHVDTIVDGELVEDILPDGRHELKYLVFDCLVLDGNSLMHRTLDKRLAYFQEKILKPYKAMYQKFPEEKAHRPFIVEDKSTQFSYALELMFREIIPKVKKIHGNDGLIFTCVGTPYKIGTDEHILKWKPHFENSIDFRMRLDFPLIEPDSEDESAGIREPYPDYDAIPTCHLYALQQQNRYIRFGTMHLEPEDWDTLKALNKPLDDTIVECYQDELSRWRYMRLREDKDEANHISTVNKVLESIQDGVSEEELLRAAPQIKVAWKKRQAMQMEEDKRRRAAAAAGGGGGVSNGVKRKLEE